MRRILSIIALVLLTAFAATAQVPPFDTPEGEKQIEQIEQSYSRPLQKAQPKKKNMVLKRPTAKAPGPKIEFSWGADAGASIDMSGQDMSSIDFDINFGMKRGWINFLGVSAQANIMMASSCRSYPLSVLFRTNFLDRPTRFFWEIKGGVALNYLEHNHSQTGVYGFTGAGFKLASGTKFSSHIIIGYTFLQRRKIVEEEMAHDFKDLHCASVKIGVVF